MYLNNMYKNLLKIIYLTIILGIIIMYVVKCKERKKLFKFNVKSKVGSQKFCLRMDRTLQASHKSCLLRPDTGPCRADILQWYYDAKQGRCFRFYWGGCQGNGNKFETEDECKKHCHLDRKSMKRTIPHFCQLTFDYGNCFGHFNRFAWDPLTKTCRRRMYSGCGGNQNNFQTRLECIKTCLTPPNNTLENYDHHTTCVPIFLHDVN